MAPTAFPTRIGFLEIDHELYSFHELLGEGAFGAVYKMRRLHDEKVRGRLANHVYKLIQQYFALKELR